MITYLWFYIGIGKEIIFIFLNKYIQIIHLETVAPAVESLWKATSFFQ